MFNQAINTDNVTRETLDGTEYVVAPINILQPMYLNVPSNWSVNEAYLPAEQAKESVPSWNGTPLTLNHPTANGVGTTANQPAMHEKTVLGRVFNAEWEDNKVTAEAWFNVEKIRDMGGMAENALERVLNGNSVEVSTGYRANKLPSGEYDGQTHNAVQGNLKPDHVAVLPNQQGKCSVEAGCGVGEPVTNSLIVTNAMIDNQDVPAEYRFDNPGEAMEKAQEMGFESIHTHGEGEDTVFMPGASHEELVAELEGMAENQLSEARTPNYDGTETQSWADVSKDLQDWADALDIDASSVSDMTQEQKQTVADHTLLGDADADAWGALRFFPVVNPNTSNLNRGALMAVLSGRGAQADIPESALESARSVADSLLDEEFESDNSGHMDEEMSENALFGMWNALKDVVGNSSETMGAESPADDNTTTMSEKTQELVDNHGFEADNLPSEDTDCFEAIYNRFVEAEEQTETETEDNMSENTDKVVFDSEEAFEEKVAEIVANREAQSEKERLASDIAANSSEYEDSEAVLEDYPTETALNTKRKDVLGGQADFSATRGADAQPATNADDAEDLTMFGSDA
jgi:hypothetical protein